MHHQLTLFSRRPQAPSSLLTGLSLYYKLDETSGTALDVLGAYDLTDNNTVTSGPGKVNTARVFTAANSESLSRADAAVFQIGTTSTTFAFWANFATLPVGGACLFSKTAVGDLSYWCDYDGTSRLRFIATSDGATAHIATANNFGAPSAATWYFIVCAYSAAGNTISIQVDEIAETATTHAGGIWPGAASFKLGARLPDEYMNGSIDEFGMWARLLTTVEVTFLRNGGGGRTYPFTG